jgi:hypothetical protein
MTPQATNRREGGLMSFRGCSSKLCAFTSKELETVRAAQKLLGLRLLAGECPVSGWWWGELKEANKPQACRRSQRSQKQAVLLTFWLKNCQKCHFSLKST